MVALLWFFTFGIAAVAGREPSLVMRTALKELDGPDRTELVRDWDLASKNCMNNIKCKTEFDDTATDMEKVANGFLAGQQVADGLSKVLEIGKFTNFAAKIGKIAPFLGAIGPLLTLFSLFFNSPEVEMLNKLMETVNKGFQRMEERFDQIEHKINDLENVVRNEHFWTRLHPSLSDLSTVQQRVINYYKVTNHAEKEERRKDLIRDHKFYDSTFEAIYVIAGAFEGKHRQIKLCDTVRDFTQVKRYEVLRVSTFLFNRMVTGAQHLVLISGLNRRKDSATTRDEMMALLKKIANLIDACDRDIATKRWIPQWRPDLDRAMNRVSGSGKEREMADAINNTLSTKYYWRDWLVVVYKEMVGHDFHWRGVCSVNHYSIDYIHWKKRYNVIVSSVDKTKPVIHQSLAGVKTYGKRRVNVWWKMRTRYTHYNAKEIYAHLPAQVKTCRYMIKGVVITIPYDIGDNFEIRAPRRRKNYVLKTKKRRFVWGRSLKYNYHLFALG